MAVRLPTPKVDLSGSILDPDQIPGRGDIRITHPDVPTDFDWPHFVLPRGRWSINRHLLNGHFGHDAVPSFSRLFIAVDTAAPLPIATGHRRTARDCILAGGAPLQLFVFSGKCCHSTTGDTSSSRVSATDTCFLLLLSSCLFERRSNGHRGAALRQGKSQIAPCIRLAHR